MKRAELPGIPPKPPRRMRRPLKSFLYAEVDRLTDENARKDIEIARLESENERLRVPLWKRITGNR